MKTFKVRLFYSTFQTVEIEAENEEDAIVKARESDLTIKEIDGLEFMENLEPWEECDEAEAIRWTK
jgi:hypothetical protein